jgi:hypothetical protein
MTDNNKKMDIVEFYINKAEELLGAEAKKREWKDWQEKLRKEEDPIERYCYDIRGERADYEITYEIMPFIVWLNFPYFSIFVYIFFIWLEISDNVVSNLMFC